MVEKKQKITLKRVMAAIDSGEYYGFCVACGYKQEGCEPDARQYICDRCDQPKVYGAEELLMYLA